MNDVLAIILGGGQGSRLFPLTQQRSKPAVPIGGKYRLIDVPISNCLHADLRRIFVLTQFNSASLNHHVAGTYRMDPFSHGFVDIIAAEQTPDSSAWFQGTADAVRQATRHFMRYEADYYLILAGDHLYRMDYGRLLDAHVDEDADITVAALPATPYDAPGMGIFRFDRDGRIVGFEEKPNAGRLAEIGSSIPPANPFHSLHFDAARPFIASMGIYVFSRAVLFDLLQSTTATDFGREVIPGALNTHRVRAYLHDGYWADVGTVESFYEANIMLTEPHAPFKFYDPRRPIYTHERFLPPSHMRSCTVRESIVAEGCFLDECSIEQSVIGIRTRISKGTHITRSVLLGADVYESEAAPPPGIGRDVSLDRVIIDKNASIGDGARLLNAAGVQQADGDGYFIRSGIIIVPKWGRIPPGTIV
jgi:glucose-1-phosphate adenylyltransferase